VIEVALEENKPQVPIPSGFGEGVQISVDATETAEAIQAKPPDKMPPLVRAAIALNLAISGNIFPVQPYKTVTVQPGTGFKAVRIIVGKKP
jgi:hypothetical protein